MQGMWLSTFFGNMGNPKMKPIAIYDDKQGCISKHPTRHTQELVKQYGGSKHLANS